MPNNKSALRRVLGMFAYYARWIDSFASKVRPLADAKSFRLSESVIKVFIVHGVGQVFIYTWSWPSGWCIGLQS